MVLFVLEVASHLQAYILHHFYSRVDYVDHFTILGLEVFINDLAKLSDAMFLDYTCLYDDT